MSSKSSAEVIIGGKMYTLSGYEGEEYLQRVASYINNKINEFNDMEEVRRFPIDMKAVMVELNIADDFFKAKERIGELEQDLKIREKEIYDLKHTLISEQIKAETAEKTVQELEQEKKDLLLQKSKLESELEEVLLEMIEAEEETDAKEAAVSDTKKSKKK